MPISRHDFFSWRFVLGSLVFCLLLFLVVLSPNQVKALDFYDYIDLNITPIPCAGLGRAITNSPANVTATCPTTEVVNPPNFHEFYSNQYNNYWEQAADNAGMSSGRNPDTINERCATSYNAPVVSAATDFPFTDDPISRHFWAEDQEITSLGKAADRSRQFVFWTLTHSAIDQALTLKQVWGVSRNIALSFLVLIATVLGLAIITAQRLRSGYKFSVRSSLTKIILSTLFIVLSASLVFVLVAVSDIIMKFFIESLGGDRVFNTYYGTKSGEINYVTYWGCRDLNIRVQEAAEAQIFLIKLTNVTHYMMGVMFILRKILLWFLLLVSPFLPLLLSFPLIRNTGKIWIGVFFQWLFYGPLFGLFFGATAKFFTDGIPFLFDFSRIERAVGYVFPTAIRLTYGGPAQNINGLNNGNYIDTFAEYIITLVLWWAATWFPWWLLRIFRDDCCDGIYAIRNAIYGYFDKPAKPVGPVGPTPPPKPPKFEGPSPEPLQTRPKTTSKDEKVMVRLDNFNMVRQAQTKDLVSTLDLRTSTLRDVARLETNKEVMKNAKTNFALLSNPLAATTATERQKYLNLRTELFTRASTRNDTVAQYMLSATNQTSQSYINRRSELSKSIQSVITKMSETKVSNLAQTTSRTTHVSADKVTSVTNSVVNNIANNQTALQSISSGAHTDTNVVKQVLQSYTQQTGQPFTQIVDRISETTQVSKDKVREILKETHTLVDRAKSVQTISQMVAPDREHVTQVMNQISSIISSVTSSASSSVSSIASNVAQQATTAGNQIVTKISEATLGMMRKEPAIITQIERSTQASATQIYETLQHVSQKGVTALKDITAKTKLSEVQIRDILMQCARIVETNKAAEISAPVGAPLDQVVRTTIESQSAVEKAQSSESDLQKTFTETTVAAFTKKLLNRIKSDEQLISSIQETVSLSKKQIEETISVLSDAPNIVDKTALEKIKQEIGVHAEQALLIVKEAIKHAQIAKDVVAPTEKDNAAEAALILEQQLETALNPESQVDQTIPMPEDEQSLEEYQEIRELWIKQYMEGEVPLSETVHDRMEWVEQDIEIITSILTRLVSQDEKVRQEALDEIGFILPVFLMNNLSGTQLITYLKAKVSAAKEAKLELGKKVLEEEEDMEEVERQTGPAEENTKHMEVDESGEVRTVEDAQNEEIAKE